MIIITTKHKTSEGKKSRRTNSISVLTAKTDGDTSPLPDLRPLIYFMTRLNYIQEACSCCTWNCLICCWQCDRRVDSALRSGSLMLDSFLQCCFRTCDNPSDIFPCVERVPTQDIPTESIYDTVCTTIFIRPSKLSRQTTNSTSSCNKHPMGCEAQLA